MSEQQKPKEKLLPCPYCGNEIAPNCISENDYFETHITNTPNYSVVCCVNENFPVPLDYYKAGCGASGGFRKTKEEAIAAWNRRVKE